MKTDHNGALILIVDDDLDSLCLIESLLLPVGYRIIKAQDGKKALNILNNILPDLVILDIIMPDVNGFQICKEMRENILPKDEFVPVIMVTGLSSKEDKLKGLAIGADDFISKPIDGAELLTRINSLLRIRYLHKRLRESYEKLKQLENIKELLYQTIVHDLKTPLTSLIGGLELLSLKSACLPHPETSWSPQCLLNIAYRLLRLIQNLLDVARMEEGKLQPNYTDIDIRILFKEIEKMFSVEAERRSIFVYWKVEKNLPIFKADKDFLMRILENLVSNALKNVKSEIGKISLIATFDNINNCIVISVIDNGRGIPKKDLEKIFDKFEQARLREKNKKYTTGLGLTFCKLAVEAHGGKINVESKIGKGTKFTFTIPLKK